MEYKSYSWVTITMVAVVLAVLLSLISWVFLGYISGVLIPQISTYALIIGVVVLLCFIFWLGMLIDSLKRNYKKDVDKFVWVMVITFTWVIGASIYLMIVKNTPSKKRPKQRK